MPIVDVRNTPTVVEVGPSSTVAEFTEEQVTAQVMVGPTVVEFSWGELIPGPGLRGGGPFEGTVHIDQDIPSLPPGLEALDSANDMVMVWDESRQEHVKRPAQFATQIDFATVPEAEAAVIADKAIAPDVAGIVYDRLHHAGQHTAGKGTETVILVPNTGLVTVDGRLSNVFYLTLTGDVSFANPSFPVNGQTINIHLKQDVFGGHEVTSWGSQWRFVNKINPTLSTDPNAIDLLSCQWNEVDAIMECSFLPNYGAGYVPPLPPTAANIIFTNVGGGNSIYRDTTGLNVNLRTLVGEGDINVNVVDDTIVFSYTAPTAVDYSAVPFLISGDPAEYPGLPYARHIVPGTGIAVDTLTDGAVTISSDLVPVPIGGTTAQVLSKLSDTDHDIAWVDPAAGGGGVSVGRNTTILATQVTPLVIVSNNTYQNTSLTIPLESGSTYLVKVQVHCDVDSNPDMYVRLSYSGSYSAVAGRSLTQFTGGSLTQEADRFAALPHDLFMNVTAQNVLDYDLLITTTTAGSITIEARQSANSPNAIQVLAGSWISAERMTTAWTTGTSINTFMRGAVFVSSEALTPAVAPVSVFFDADAVIKRIVVLGDVNGSAIIDIRKSSLAAAAGGEGGTSICGGDLMTLSSTNSLDKTSFPGWTTTIAAGECLNFDIPSTSVFKRLVVQVFCEETF